PSFFFFPSSPPFFFFLLLPPPPSSPLFPYTTLFRSPHVLLDPLGQLAGRRHAAGALRQTLRDALALLEIAVDDHLLLARQRLADALGVHVGVAVHVAARPGSDVQDGRHPRRAGLRAVELLQRLR